MEKLAEDKTQIDQSGVSYITFLKELLIRPSEIKKTPFKKLATHGLFSLVIISFLMSSVLYTNLLQSSCQWLLTITFQTFFLLPGLALFVVFLLLGSITFAILKVMGMKASFMDVISRFGSFLFLPMLLFIIASVTAYFHLETSLTFFIIGALAICISIFYTFYSYQTTNVTKTAIIKSLIPSVLLITPIIVSIFVVSTQLPMGTVEQLTICLTY
ncbi:hypothetical protein [Evansella tamaricis]|uniref:Yip1 domain-containing protein n=1 Tax=Evansella tamaricis TaxID=2069301 RepID=A0ABS6JCJ0_9BACI|nr:hypothetical protein [Evansella tamaricis]MBU9711296.1 hypothetical protein [Evansella tamaricis]